ncbi:MAG TPA: hypothetical protein VMH50_17085 [Thermoleophilia bacterium]|nr:hypothetical protein [Thermoleophilia bacterium]
MKSTSQTRVAVIAVLSLLLLLALVAGAQAAAAAHFSDGSAATTPAAGTQGRGGIDASQVDAIAATTPAAGTQGRGGVDASQLDAIAASSSASSAAGTTASAGSVARTFSHGRGAFPLPQAGTPPTATLTPSSTGSSVGVGLAALGAVLAAAAIALWAMSRRRTSRSEARDASYCASHPSDPICGAG